MFSRFSRCPDPLPILSMALGPSVSRRPVPDPPLSSDRSSPSRASRLLSRSSGSRNRSSCRFTVRSRAIRASVAHWGRAYPSMGRHMTRASSSAAIPPRLKNWARARLPRSFRPKRPVSSMDPQPAKPASMAPQAGSAPAWMAGSSGSTTSAAASHHVLTRTTTHPWVRITRAYSRNRASDDSSMRSESPGLRTLYQSSAMCAHRRQKTSPPAARTARAAQYPCFQVNIAVTASEANTQNISAAPKSKPYCPEMP